MAKKKKVMTDNDYEEFNKWMTEQESKPTPGKIELVHDDGSIWYQGIRGGHGDRDFVRHRLQYPAIPFTRRCGCSSCGSLCRTCSPTLIIIRICNSF